MLQSTMTINKHLGCLSVYVQPARPVSLAGCYAWCRCNVQALKYCMNTMHACKLLSLDIVSTCTDMPAPKMQYACNCK